MIAIIKNGVLERIVETVDGISMTGRTVADLPSDYDAGAVNYVFNGTGFVPNIALAMQRLRAERDVLLAATDWTQLADQSDAIKSAWAPYRQALRDLPEVTSPFTPEWPTPPA